MRLGLTDTSWDYIGAKLAQSGDDEQIAFFKSFVKECKTWGTEMQIQSQFAGINSGLSNDEISTLSMITYEGGENE